MTRVRPDRQAIRRRALEHMLLGILPLVITAEIVYYVYSHGNAAVDFQHSFWLAGWRTLHGGDPYAWTGAEISGGVSFPYPAPTALLLAPFGLLSSFAESIPITVAAIAAGPLTLRILDVRDWRVYGAVALWQPVVIGWQTANFTLALVIGTALLWRFRDRQLVAALLVALLASIKPILVPLWFWLLLTRRWRAAAYGAALGLLLNVVSWTVLGWPELGRWLGLISLQGRLRDSIGYSLVSLATHVGLGRAIGYALMVGIGCALMSIAVRLARAQQQDRAFAVAIMLTIVVSPQVDTHYFAMLLVPLAISRPRLSWVWLVPIVLWVCPAAYADRWQILIWWVLAGVMAHQLFVSSNIRSRDQPTITT